MFASCTRLSTVVALAVAATAVDAPRKRQIPITVDVSVSPVAIPAGNGIPLVVRVTNGLDDAIEFHGYGTEANDWNAETVSVSFFDIYRDGDDGQLFLAAPKVEPPLTIAGMSRQVIRPGESLRIEIDARKWTIRDGWKPGHYRAVVQVKYLRADEYCTLNVLSDPFEFDIAE
jgi:hypothetical protein